MRKENWPTLLDEYLQRAKKTKFKWGDVDCATWAADFVVLITDEDYASEFRGEYKTEKGALSQIKKTGHDSLEKLVDSKLNQVLPNLAQKGDVVLHPKYDAIGICAGVKSAFLTKEGITFENTTHCRRAWRIE